MESKLLVGANLTELLIGRPLILGTQTGERTVTSKFFEDRTTVELKKRWSRESSKY
ncbi:hypothetical protein OESDEN_14618, partial [Oesophagostomum dentatum]